MDRSSGKYSPFTEQNKPQKVGSTSLRLKSPWHLLTTFAICFICFHFDTEGVLGCMHRVEPALQNLKKNYWSQNQKASDNEILLEEIQITENVPVKLAKWNKGHRSKPSWMMNPPLPQVTKTELLLTVWIQYQAGRWREWRRTSIMGLVVEPIPNSLNSHHKSCMADSKDNY